MNGYSFHSDWLNGEYPRDELMLICTGWPSGMLVGAYKQCYNQLPGVVDGCAVFEASRDEEKAKSCRSTGEVVTEVNDLRLGVLCLSLG